MDDAHTAKHEVETCEAKARVLYVTGSWASWKIWSNAHRGEDISQEARRVLLIDEGAVKDTCSTVSRMWHSVAYLQLVNQTHEKSTFTEDSSA